MHTTFGLSPSWNKFGWIETLMKMRIENQEELLRQL